MHCPDTRRSTHQKLSIFRSCFTGLTNVYGTYDPRTGRVRQVKEPVTGRVILRHLQGRQPYGVYLLDGDRTRALAIDFDDHDLNPPMELLAAARNYGVATYIEVSKSKGYHVWMFFEEIGVVAARARRLAQLLLDDIGMPETEVFPKHDRLDDRAQYGNFINAPLFGALVPKGRTVFLDDRDFARPHRDQWALLEGVKRVTASDLDDILETEGLTQLDTSRGQRGGKTPLGLQSTFGLPPCAQRMLAKGVTEYQRIACFRLALHLRKAGIPEDVAVAGLMAWAVKNHPTGGKRIITEQEITEQARWAYTKDYRGCGCEDPAIRPHCDPSCPLESPESAACHPERQAAQGKGRSLAMGSPSREGQ